MSKLTNWLVENPSTAGLSVAVLIVVIGLFAYGFGDLMKFSPRRVWAIGGVVFRESIRRKVLWLTPLIMLGIIALTGVQRPEDELDAIRQTLQFSLFASGLLVVVSGIMLSCTNLPRDIETRVIFTIVTKPTTRLEIVLGKIIGFARVTGSILLLMGVFTWGYVHLRAWQLDREIAGTLAVRLDNEFARGRLEHLHREGLLDTRNLRLANGYNVVARESAAGSNVRWASTQQGFTIPFQVEREALIPKGFADVAKGETPPGPGDAGAIIRLVMSTEQIGKVEVPRPVVHAPMLPDDDATASPYGAPSVNISVIDTAGDFDIIPASQINNGKPIALKVGPNGIATIEVDLNEKTAPALANLRNWSVSVTPTNENFIIGMAPGAVSVVIPGNGEENFHTLAVMTATDRSGTHPILNVRGGSGRSGRMLEGPQDNFQATAIAHFEGPEPRAGADGTVALELKLDIERTDDDAVEEATQVELAIDNPHAAKPFGKIFLTPEKNKTVYADLPADAFVGGEFDVKLRTMTRGHAVTLGSDSFAVVESRHWFSANLGKALFTQWLLSALVVTIGTCCSTFLSWPIAIVLSVLVLMARWTVDQLTDSLQPGIGARLATDIGTTNATQARVISTTFDSLARLLNFISQFLPNIDRFSTADSVQRGLWIPFASVGSAAIVLLLFGLPLLSLSYVIFRNKEVAP